MSPETYEALAARAHGTRRTVSDVAEKFIAWALEVPAPSSRMAKIHCERCGTIDKHMYTSPDVIAGGYTYRYRCVACYRPRPFGFVLLLSAAELAAMRQTDTYEFESDFVEG